VSSFFVQKCLKVKTNFVPTDRPQRQKYQGFAAFSKKRIKRENAEPFVLTTTVNY